LLAVLLLLVCPILAQAEKTRVALVSGERSERIANVLALAQAQLSTDADLELLDREQIRRVLEEKKVALSGVVDSRQALEVGQLLTVDLFAAVESQPDAEAPPAVVIFDARSGVRYGDTLLPATAAEPARAADAVAAAVRAATRKRVHQGLHTIGLLAVRNADLPRSQDGLCETVGLLLERGLPRSPDIAVLERRRLEHVNEERSLPIASPPAGLLASLVNVELEIARAPEGQGLTATALLTEVGKNQPRKITVQIPEPNAPLLAEALLAKLIEALQAAPVEGAADPLIEASRFDREAGHYFSHDDFADAVRAEEASNALDPANAKYSARLSLYLLRQAVYLFSPAEIHTGRGGADAWENVKVDPATLEQLLIKASRGVEISSELFRRSVANKLSRETGHTVDFDNSLEQICQRLRGLRKISPPAAQQDIEAFLNLCRSRSLESIETAAKDAEADPRNLDHYASAFQSECHAIKSFSIDTAHYAETMHQLTSRWLAVTQNWQPKFNKWNGGEAFNMLLAAMVNEGGYSRWPWPVDDKEYAQKMAPLYLLMQQHSRPVVRLYGLLGELRGDVLLGRITEEAGAARFATGYRKLAQEIITAPEPWHAARTRAEAYEAWRSAIENLPGKDRRAFVAREYLELCNFMISRHELIYKVVDSALETLDDDQPSTALALAHRMSALIDSPQFKDVEDNKSTVRSDLNTAEQKILSAHPELASAHSELPWSRASKIFDVSQFPELHAVVAHFIADDVVYGFGFEFEGERSYLRLVRIPLAGTAQLLGKVDLNITPGRLQSYERNHFIPSAGLDGNTIYAATRGAGIVIFPLGDDTGRRIDTQSGLPSDTVTSAACLDGKLYAGVGEGYLIGYDLKQNRCDVIASSRRKEKRTPFDDRDPFRVPYMIRDPQRERIVFVIGDHLWQVTPADDRISQVLDLAAVQHNRSRNKLNGDNLGWGSPLHGDRILLSDPFHVLSIDLRENKAESIHNTDHGVFQMWPPHLLLDGWIWSNDYFARLSLKKREQEKFPPLDNTQFRPSQCLALTDDGRQVLAGNERSLWLLELRAPE
jgi:hypothetical protein